MWILLSMMLAWGEEPIQKVQFIIEETFGEEIAPAALERAAINGMLQTIEIQTGLKGSQAMSKLEHEEYLTRQLGGREGYGLRVQLQPGRGFFVDGVIPDGPAAAAGVERGDVIISLADHPFTGLKPEQMLTILHQEYEGSIPMDIVRDEELRRFDLEKGLFQLQLISLEEALSIHFFGRGASGQLRRYLYDASNQGLIIDLRDTDGGLWEEAIAAVDLFVSDEKVIGYRRTIDGIGIPIISKEEALYNAPVIILINQGTSGPAELFALSLQEHERAMILGVSSAGNASDFRVYSIDEDVIIRLVDTEILSPQKRSWTGQGVEPNMLIRQNIALPAYGTSATDIQLETALRLLSTF